MTIRTAILGFIFLCVLSTRAFGSTPQTSQKEQTGEASRINGFETDSSASSEIDPAKKAAIRQLIDLLGGTASIIQEIDEMEKDVRTKMAKDLPPGVYRQKLIDLFFERFRSKADIGQLLDRTAQIYNKYLSEEDIKGLIQFYSTPLGQKTLRVDSNLSIELNSDKVKWGQSLGSQSMNEVLSEHPELAKALKRARKNTPKSVHAR